MVDCVAIELNRCNSRHSTPCRSKRSKARRIRASQYEDFGKVLLRPWQSYGASLVISIFCRGQKLHPSPTHSTAVSPRRRTLCTGALIHRILNIFGTDLGLFTTSISLLCAIPSIKAWPKSGINYNFFLKKTIGGRALTVQGWWSTSKVGQVLEQSKSACMLLREWILLLHTLKNSSI